MPQWVEGMEIWGHLRILRSKGRLVWLRLYFKCLGQKLRALLELDVVDRSSHGLAGEFEEHAI